MNILMFTFKILAISKLDFHTALTLAQRLEKKFIYDLSEDDCKKLEKDIKENMLPPLNRIREEAVEDAFTYLLIDKNKL